MARATNSDLATDAAAAGGMKKPRRNNDEGSVFQRGNSWVGMISLGVKPDGSRNRPTFTAPTKKEVIAKIRAAKTAFENKEIKPDKSMTVADLMSKWLEMIVEPNVRPRTYASYSDNTRLHIVPLLGRYKVCNLNALIVDEFLAAKSKSGLSSQTVRYIRGILRNAINQAIKWDVVQRNVVRMSKEPAADDHDPKLFTHDQAVHLIDAFGSHRHGALFKVLVGLGIRLGEALGLRWSDLEMENDAGQSRVNIRVQLQRLDGAHVLTNPKSRAGRRTIYLPEFVAEALIAHRKYQNEVIIPAAGDCWSNKFGLVFTNNNGGPLDQSHVRRGFKALLARRDLDFMRLHDCRHMCASLLVSGSVHPRIVMEILGHCNISLTMNRYSHVMPRNSAQAAQALNAAIAKPSNH